MSVVLSRKPGGSGGGGGAPSGPAGGSLDGTYPNPTIAAGAVDTAELANDAVEAAQIAAGAVGRSELATGIGAWDLIDDQELGGDAANIDFSGIAGTYRHLYAVGMLRGTTAATTQQGTLRINNDSGGNYDRGSLIWITTATGFNSVAQTSFGFGAVAAASASADRFSRVIVEIPFYSDTSFMKTLEARTFTRHGTNAGDQELAMSNGLWRSTAAITRLTFLPGADNWVAGSRISLYGIN